MKKLLFVTLLTTTFALNAKNDTLRFSFNVVRGPLYETGYYYAPNLNPAIYLNYKSILIGMPIPKQYEASTGIVYETKAFAFSGYIGYEIYDDFFSYFSLGRYGTRWIYLQDESQNGINGINRLGLGILYMSDKKHYTIGVDMRGSIVGNEILYWNPTMTIGLNFTTADFKKFINFIK